MLRRAFAGIAVALGMVGGCLTARAADAVPLASHRALYDMTLDRTHSGSNVTGVNGEMAIEWLRSCDGWTFQHESSMTVQFAAGEAARLATTATSWESYDGLHYRFSLRNMTDGDESERIEGTASIGRPGGAGEAEVTAPKPHRFALPAGTLFPVAHTREVLRRARSGQPPTTFEAVVFDGMGDDGPMDATTTIGRMRRAGPAKGTVGAALDGQMLWPVSVAYYSRTSASPLPKQEVGMSLYANGVADDLTIGFDDFVVRARLAKLEYVAAPRCDGRDR